MSDTIKWTDEVKRAKTAQERRRAAPPITMESVTMLRRKQLSKVFAPECVPERDARGKVTKPADFHPFWDERANVRELVEKGYEPVLDKGDHGQPVLDEGDMFFRLPMDIHLENIKLAPMISDRKLMERPNVQESMPSQAVNEKMKIIQPGDPGQEAAIQEIMADDKE